MVERPLYFFSKVNSKMWQSLRTLIKSFVATLDKASYNLVDFSAFCFTFRGIDFELFGHLFESVGFIADDYVQDVFYRVDDLMQEYPGIFGNTEELIRLSSPYMK